MRYFATAFLILACSLALCGQPITASPSTLNFSGTPGSSLPAQIVAISSTGSPLWSALPTNYSGNASGWLTVSPTQMNAPTNVTFSINATGRALPAGNYSASVVLFVAGQPDTTINVNLCLGAAGACTGTLSTTPTSLAFIGTQGAPPASQSLAVVSSSGTLTWSAATTTVDGANWLSVSPSTGDTVNNPNAIVSVNLSVLPTTNAVYTGNISFNSGAAQVPVTLTVGSGGPITLAVSSNSYTFYGVAGSPQAGQQLIIGDNTSTGLGWTSSVSSTSPWLTLATTSGTTQFTNTINVNTSGLTAGSYSGTITINAPGSVNGSVSVGVTLILAADSGNQLSLTNLAGNKLSSLVYIVSANTVSSQSFNIASSGGGSVQWGSAPSTDSGGPWLSVSPRSGITPFTPSASVNTTGLAAGTYTGSITFSGVGISAPSLVSVTLIVNAVAGLSVTPNSVSFTGGVGDTLPSQSLTVGSTTANVGFNWTATVTTGPQFTGWLTLSSYSGTTTSGVIVQVNTAGLLAGVYTGTITFTAQNSPPVQVPVTLTIATSATLTVNSISYSFTGTVGSNIAGQSLQIGSTIGSLAWTAVTSVQSPPGSNWLQLSANFGSTPANININPITTGLAPGTYTGSIALTGIGASNSQLINVTLTITPGASLAATPSSLSFTGSAGGTLPTQNLSVTNSTATTASIPWTATAIVTSPAGGNWLSVSPASGTTPGIAAVTVSTVNLGKGTYTGSIQITSTGATNTVTIPVTLNVTASAITVGSSTLTFAGTAGGNVAPQTLNIGSSGGTSNPLNWTAAVATQSGGQWLSILPTSGQTPSSAVISVASASLAPGNYTGTIVISASDGNSSQTVNVSLTVNALSIIALSPSTLQFVAARPVLSQQSATFDVQNLGIGAMSFTANASTISGGNWLSVTPNSGTAPATLTVNVNAQGLAAGSYIGAVNVTPTGSTNALNAPQTLVVTLSVDVPAIYNGGIVNGASFAPDNTASPDALMSLFGANLAASTVSASGLPLPTTLGSTQVLVNGNPVPLFFVSTGQINFVFPEAAGTSALVSVVVNGQRSLNAIVNVAAADPGIFPTGGGQGLGQVLNQDFSANSPAHPASAGQVVQMFVTGLGVTFPRQTPGQPGNSAAPFNGTVLQPTVTIGGINAPVVFSAAAPGLAGVYQVNATVPAGLPTGGFAVMQLTINGKTSNAVNVAIK